MSTKDKLDVFAAVAVKSWSMGRAAGLSDKVIEDGICSAFIRAGVDETNARIMADVASGNDLDGWLAVYGDKEAQNKLYGKRI